MTNGTSPIENYEERYEKIVQNAKIMISTQYYIVGILEQFDDTLKIFEKLLPEYFKGVYDLYKNDKQIAQAIKNSATLEYPKMSAASREFFQKGPLRYEYDLYMFARTVFNDFLKSFNI